MKFPTLKKIVLRLYNFYVKEHFDKIVLALFLSFGVAGGTAAIAWLLDPAVKKIFMEQDKTMMLLIPAAIVFAFSVKGLSLYFSRIALIKVSNEIIRKLSAQMTSRILESDTHTLESKHSGKYISHFLYDVGLISNMVGTGVLNLMKDSLTLIVLIGVMFYQNWKLACFALIMMPMAAFVAKSMGKRLGKVTAESAVVAGDLSKFLSEMIKGSRMIKIYQQEKFEFIMQVYPDTDYATDARFKIDLIIDQLAAKEMSIARYYMKTEKWIPALNRLKVVVDQYDKTIFIEEALHRLVEVYYRLGLLEEAKQAGTILGYNYRSGDWYKRSYKVFNREYKLAKGKKEKRNGIN